ncbi:hypothetical protein [Pasteuria penetrans]|uniref:hypothetical protein n=1 Tax=Pasteuria penetrans TaxID=86005 RepID=UPI000FBA42C8|nr:hypothetical protein [Pasteuria penetrans]
MDVAEKTAVSDNTVVKIIFVFFPTPNLPLTPFGTIASGSSLGMTVVLWVAKEDHGLLSRFYRQPPIAPHSTTSATVMLWIGDFKFGVA